MLPDRLPEDLHPFLRQEGLDPKHIKAAVRGDILPDGAFGEVWVVASASELGIIWGRTEGKDSSARWIAAGSRVLALDDLEDVRTEEMVGNGALAAKVRGEHERLCRYSNRLSRRFAAFAKAVEKLRKGEEPGEGDFEEAREPDRCPRCGRYYPEPGRRVCPHCMDRRALSLRVLSFFSGYEVKVALIVLFMLGGAGLNLVSPYMNGRVLFDEVLTPGGRYEGRVLEVVGLVALMQLAALVLNIAHQRINANMTAYVIAGLKIRVYQAMQRLSLGFFTSKQTGGLMARVNIDADNLQYFFHDGVPYFVVNSLQIAGIVTAMLLMNWKLALLLLIPVPVIVLLMRRAFPRLWRLFSRRYRKLRLMNSAVNDTLTGVRVVKAFGREPQEVRRFRGHNEAVYDVSLQTGYFMSGLFPTLTLLVNAGGLVVWGLGGYEVLQGRITFGTLMTFTFYLGMLYGPLEFMTHIVDWWTVCINSAQRIFEMLDATPDVAERPDPVGLPRMRGEVELRNVTFAYEPNKPVLKNVTFHVRAGEMIGIVGRSGAGKSTLINLISRLYDVSEGAILIDGIDVRDLAIEDLRSQIGIVPQETFLFRGSVAENIAYAKPDAPADEIIRAAKAANAHDFIVKLPDGYETIIGVRGHDLSGGERQRIAIARAVLQDPRILILDEATASVDTETERQIHEALAYLVKGRTTFAIAHRLSTLKDADRIVVVDKGEVVEIGTHDELERNEGLYHKLRKQQEEALAIRGVAK